MEEPKICAAGFKQIPGMLRSHYDLYHAEAFEYLCDAVIGLSNLIRI